MKSNVPSKLSGFMVELLKQQAIRHISNYLASPSSQSLRAVLAVSHVTCFLA